MFNSTIENAFCCILAVARSMILLYLYNNFYINNIYKYVYNLDLQTCISRNLT